ncbi:MAG: hypothetical protein B7Y41_04335 [Hydrogenophilales bacterium 28-61-23]|nr:MAG: hypothetical protein B7Y41_04335 [Hydrogenophilales bacterium 28-61-23]
MLTPTLSRALEADPALDQKQLHALGLDHVRRLSRRLWTDHNLHDPGITTLELLCYALTDLAYRTRFPVEDLLASPDKNAENMAAQFFTPRQILPNRALTERDYRKLLIDLPDIKNAWLYPVTPVIYADTVRGELLREYPRRPGVRAVRVAGQYGVRIEYMDSVSSQEKKDEVRATAAALLQANRNLCEDFVAYEEIGGQPYSLCAELELAPDADPVEVAAQIRFQVERYLAPPVRCHSLSQMLARTHADGSAYSVAEIFEGPALQCGFIDDAELDAAALREEVRLSDIIGIVMDIPGLRALRDIVVNPLEWNPLTKAWDAVEAEDKWRMAVPTGKQPTLSDAVGRLVFYKRNVPVPADPAKVAERIDALEEAERLSLETFNAEDLPIPLGHARDTGSYHSFQHHFPEVYGISSIGLSANADAQRRAQALQFKGYLLFFDQVMANYFAQLSNLRSLFRRNFAEDYALDHGAARTCFAQRVESFPDFDKIYRAGVDAQALAGLLEDESAGLERRNRILDHLLARFAEEFHHYASIMRSAFGASPLTGALAKSRFLMDIPALGAERGLAWNKSLNSADALWNSFNVSGLERRIARLLGIGNHSRRNLGAVSYDTYAELDKTPDDEFRFRVKHPVSGKILLSSSTHYATPEAAKLEMRQAIERAQLVEGYQRKTTVDGKHYFNIVDAGGEVIARRIEYYATPDLMEAAIDALTTHLREYCSGEGLYLIENLLLLPGESQPSWNDPFMPICVDPNRADCADDDPYSYRIHVVLPAYAGRFQHMAFRGFVEETIRQETPAHILPKVCWANESDMAELEQAYRDWIPVGAGVTSANRSKKMKALIDILFRIKSVYPTRRLYDCGGDETKPPFILGRTALGSEDLKA